MESELAIESLAHLIESTTLNIKDGSTSLDELSKSAAKYHTSLEASMTAGHEFLIEVEKAGVVASKGLGETKRLGDSLRLIAGIHRSRISVEKARIKRFGEQFIFPLGKRIRADHKIISKIEDGYRVSSKAFRSELKKMNRLTLAAQRKRVRSGSIGNGFASNSLKTLHHKTHQLEGFHQRVLSTLLVEERKRYCYLLDNLISVFQENWGSEEERRHIGDVLRLTTEPDKLAPDHQKIVLNNSSSRAWIEESNDAMATSPLLPSSTLEQHITARVNPNSTRLEEPPSFAEATAPPSPRSSQITSIEFRQRTGSTNSAVWTNL